MSINISSYFNESEEFSNASELVIKSTGTVLSYKVFTSVFLLYLPGIVTNILSLIFIALDGARTSLPTNLLLFILSLTDLTAVFSTGLWHLFGWVGIITTYDICAVKTFMTVFCPIYSGMISLFMAIDRVLAFTAPFFYRRNVTRKRWLFACFCSFMFVSSVSILPHIGLGGMWREQITNGKVSYKCSAVRTETEHKKMIFLIVFATVGLLLVTGIIICNAVVVNAVLNLKRRTDEVQKTSGANNGQSKVTEIRFAVIVVLLACVFITCWLPYNVLLILTILGATVDSTVKGKIHLLAGYNYVIDPFVYLVIRKSNRQLLRRIFCSRCQKDEFEFPTTASTDGSENKTFDKYENCM